MAYRKTSQIIVSLLACLSIEALEEKPWFYPPFEMHGKGAIAGSFFSTVDNGYNPFGYHSTNIQATLGLLVPFAHNWDAELEMEVEHTSKNNFGVESGALQVRRQFLDDIAGDFLSLDLGLNARFVPKNFVRDVATPYHDLWNFEIVTALGKEFAEEGEWYFRTFLSGAAGQANRGYPWLKANFDAKAKAFKSYEIGAFVRSYFGFGPYTLINVREFEGYSMFQHQSVDIGVSFAFLFKVYGSLTFSYVHRAFARSYPDDYNSFAFVYDLPFSF